MHGGLAHSTDAMHELIKEQHDAVEHILVDNHLRRRVELSEEAHQKVEVILGA